LFDTCIAIHLRDNTTGIHDFVSTLSARAFLSSVSRVELEGGVAAVPEISALRRAKLDIVLSTVDIIDFTDKTAQAYGQIVAQSGFNRRKIIDRMIAATALVNDLTLITTNGEDFEDIKDLKLEIWTL
jgi:tRNA(fMet)-specific endonuclease VapC